MEKNYTKNCDRILQAVLSDESLIVFGGYNPLEVDNIDCALASDNLVVRTVAQIINGVDNGDSNKEIYTIVSNYLKSNI